LALELKKKDLKTCGIGARNLEGKIHEFNIKRFNFSAEKGLISEPMNI
jgi:hypothetical protein